MSLHMTILGCGSSGGVPRLGGPDGAGDWGACDPHDPRNRRSRCSILVTRQGAGGQTTVLVDTAPDLRQQLLHHRVRRLDAVLFSHDHADQTHGLDDVRPLFYARGQSIPCYWDAPTQASLFPRFTYAFTGSKGYPAILDPRPMPAPGTDFSIPGAGGDLPVRAILQDHGSCASLGFRFGDMAYSNDVVGLDDAAFEQLAGVRVWVVDCLRYAPHPTHAHLDKTLGWIARLQPQLAVLTNLHIDLDYATLAAQLPAGVIPAHDGLVLT